MKRKQADEGAESDGDTMEIEAPVAETPKAAKKLKTKAMGREFSVKEISRLKKVETLFDSSLLRMQISELLKNVTLKQKFQSRIEFAVKYLSGKLKNLPEGEECSISDRSLLKEVKIEVPLTGFHKDTKGVFRFVAPTDVRLIGSVNLDTCVKPHVEVDLALLLPKEFFQSSDNLNQRFMRKKALYLAALTMHLSKFKKVQYLNYSYHMGNPLLPVLIATVNVGDSKTIDCKLHVIPESHPFKLSKFHLSKNNVRPKWLFDKKTAPSEKEEDNEDVSSLPSTKHYNSSILHDLCIVGNEDRVRELLSGSEGLKHGIMLLKIWLRLRELSQGFGWFSNFLMTAYVAFLTKTKKLNKMMNGFQVFKTTLQLLSKSDWKGEPPSLHDEGANKTTGSLEALCAEYDCVFVDSTGSFNMAYMLSEGVFERVQQECEVTLELLKEPEQTVFGALFVTNTPFVRKFDHIFHVHIRPTLLSDESFDKHPSLKSTELDLGLACRTLGLQQLLLATLRKALGKRAVTVQAKPTVGTKWHTSLAPYKYDSRSYLTFGVVLDPSEAYNILNKGPAADSAEAPEFREFWGEKSEMRRFKDGSIHEAVLWSSSINQSDKRIICKSIVMHILNEHYGIKQVDIMFRANPLDSLLEVLVKGKPESQKYGTGEENALVVLKAFEQISRIVRSTSDLPLSVTSVEGVHPIFRQAEVFPPFATGLHVSNHEKVKDGQCVPCSHKNLPPFIPVLPVICNLEGTGKFPSDAVAIKHMKALLHVKLGEELKTKFSKCVCVHSNFIDVYQDGFVFRLTLAISKEITVLRTVVSSTGMLLFEDTEESLVLERDTVALPRFSHLIHSIQQQHYVFSATVRLCKRWLSSQMVWNQLREEVIELMVASIFIKPFPYSVPASPSVGFMRFLHLFSTFDWKNEVLLVDLNQEFNAQDFSEIPQSFKNNRKSLPAMCIATPQDKKGSLWTKESPAPALLDRLVILARASLKSFESQIMSFESNCDFKKIFRPALEHFDISIKLRPLLNVSKYQAVDTSQMAAACDMSKGGFTSKNPMPVVDFNVYQKYLTDIQEIYGNLAYFFFDRLGGNVIGMVWKNQAFKKEEFKISNLPMRCLVLEGEKVNLEMVKATILEDIKVLGSGIIDTITNHRQTV